MRLHNPSEYKDADCLAREIARIMVGSDVKTKAVLVPVLMKYKLGLPIQPIEHSGEIGLAEKVAAMRKRVIEGVSHGE